MRIKRLRKLGTHGKSKRNMHIMIEKSSGRVLIETNNLEEFLKFRTAYINEQIKSKDHDHRHR